MRSVIGKKRVVQNEINCNIYFYRFISGIYWSTCGMAIKFPGIWHVNV